MADVEIKSRRQLVTDAITRIVTYTSQITWFGPNSVGSALANAIGGQTSLAYRLFKAVARRLSLRGAAGDVLTKVAAERGAQRRQDQRARVLVVLEPQSTTVSAITIGLTTRIEVASSSAFAAGDNVRVVNSDGTLTERADVISVSTGTGPNSGDEIEVSMLVNAYDPATDDTRVVLRHDVLPETEINSQSGAVFLTTEQITVGDFNPLLAGESSTLALVDKVWCEAKDAGAAGDIPPRSITGLAVADADVVRVYNPERAFGGADEESDPDLRHRTAHQGATRSRETEAWLEAIAVQGGFGVLRAIQLEPDEVATFRAAIIARNGGPLSERRRAAVQAYVQERVRSFTTIAIENAVLTAVEVEARVHLSPDVTLRQAWRAAGASLAQYLDYRKWEWGTDPDYLELLRRVRNADGILAVEETSFLPTANPDVADDSIPVLVRLSMQDIDSGDTINGALAVSFDSSPSEA